MTTTALHCANDRDAAWRANRPDAGGALAAVRPAAPSTGEAWPGCNPVRDAYAPAPWPAATSEQQAAQQNARHTPCPSGIGPSVWEWAAAHGPQTLPELLRHYRSDRAHILAALRRAKAAGDHAAARDEADELAGLRWHFQPLIRYVARLAATGAAAIVTGPAGAAPWAPDLLRDGDPLANAATAGAMVGLYAFAAAAVLCACAFLASYTAENGWPLPALTTWRRAPVRPAARNRKPRARKPAARPR